jgi:hypothetical protein
MPETAPVAGGFGDDSRDKVYEMPETAPVAGGFGDDSRDKVYEVPLMHIAIGEGQDPTISVELDAEQQNPIHDYYNMPETAPVEEGFGDDSRDKVYEVPLMHIAIGEGQDPTISVKLDAEQQNPIHV